MTQPPQLWSAQCALTHREIELPPFPYPVQVSCEPLRRALQKPELSFLLEQYGKGIELAHDLDRCDTQSLNNMRWMLTPWMPYLELSDQWMAASSPFSMDMLFVQDGFGQRFLDEKGQMKLRSHVDGDTLQRARVLKAIDWILQKVYGRQHDFDPSVVFIRPDEQGLERYYQFRFDSRFIDVECQGSCPIISDADLESLSIASGSGLNDWLAMFPTDRFVFKGFSMVSAVDVTVKEAQSGLLRELDRGTVIDEGRLKRLQRYMRVLSRSPHVTLRLHVKLSDQLMVLQPKGESACVMANSTPIPLSELKGTAYLSVLQGDDQVWLNRDAPHSHPKLQGQALSVDDQIGEQVLLMALVSEGETLGVMELSAKERRCLQSIDPFVMMEVKRAIADAIQKDLDHLQQRIQQVVQEHCTALHSAVRWRFNEEAKRFLESGQVAQFDDIAFEDVVPLFSQSDIQSSSHFRNEAIRMDLEAQLHLAQRVLLEMQAEHALPIVGEVLFQLEQMQNRLQDGLSSSDEFTIQQFLKHKVEHVFRDLIAEQDRAYGALGEYRSALDDRFGMIHDERERYESSVKQINSSISAMIDAEQISAQKMIAHYAEKTMTDGVELSMYVGDTLLKGNTWSQLHLHNLRLWQLILTCRIARRCRELETELPLPLKMTHLILVQDMPLTIRFSTEEKEFVVDGAYNIRYAIIKKRIDKALVANSKGERLTQAGQIAVVYSHQSEAELYREFFAYVHRLGLIEQQVEELELEDLQSLQGMKAMRVTVMPERREEPRGQEPTATDLMHQGLSL